MEIILEILLEIILQVLVEIAAELGFATVAEALRRGPANPILATIGFLILGALVGGASLLVAPERLLPAHSVRGLSLLVTPLAVGVIMRAWGVRRRAQGRPSTNLATFHGGAAFAFGTALVRYVGLK